MFFHAKNFYKFLRYVRYHHFESFGGNIAGWKGCRERGLFFPVWLLCPPINIIMEKIITAIIAVKQEEWLYICQFPSWRISHCIEWKSLVSIMFTCWKIPVMVQAPLVHLTCCSDSARLCPDIWDTLLNALPLEQEHEKFSLLLSPMCTSSTYTTPSLVSCLRSPSLSIVQDFLTILPHLYTGMFSLLSGGCHLLLVDFHLHQMMHHDQRNQSLKTSDSQPCSTVGQLQKKHFCRKDLVVLVDKLSTS